MKACMFSADPPMYAESLTGAVDIRDEDDDQPGSVGDYMFTPMYTYVYDYRYRCPPAYSEVCPMLHVCLILSAVWSELPHFFGEIWHPGQVREFKIGQGKVGEIAESHGNVSVIVCVYISIVLHR